MGPACRARVRSSSTASRLRLTTPCNREGFGNAGNAGNAGYDASTLEDDDLDWLIATCGNAQSGRIGKAELAFAIARGAVVIAADGSLAVNRNVRPLPVPRGIRDPLAGGGDGSGVVIDGQPDKTDDEPEEAPDHALGGFS